MRAWSTWAGAVGLMGMVGVAGSAGAQDCPAGMTCHYVPPAMVVPGGSVPESEMWLSVPSGSASGSYQVDGAAAVTFDITSAAALRVPLAMTATSSGVNVPETRGVFVVASRDDLLVEHKQTQFMSSSYTEGYSETVPRHTVALGTRFRLGGFRMTRGSPIGIAATSQYAMITAPEGATVTLTAPPGAALPYWTGSAGETHEITLTGGQSVNIAANASLDGALLTATAPVSVASGGRGWHDSGCGDDGSDVLVPTSQYGTEFVVRLPDRSASGTDVSVIADVDGTEVRVDGTLAATLAAGEHHSFAPTSPAHIETSQPALVWMNGSRASCEMDTALIPPLVLAALPLSISFNASFDAEVTVVVETASVPALTVDGAAPAGATTVAVPGRADVSVVVFTVPAGLHLVSADHGFQLMAAYAGAGAGVLAYFGPFVSCTTAAACPDVGPCSIEECLVNACVSTPVAAGLPGDCGAGLVCDSDGACVMPPDLDAGPPEGDAGAPETDAGTPETDAGTPETDAGTPGADAGTPARDGGGMGRDAGRGGTETEGGCGCTIPSAPAPRLSWIAGLAIAGLVAGRRLRRRR